ncbi:ankyrin repeat-containing domain protein [Coniochaeta sp. 2T2.1]|nr:ankyrin repeat-containing domain protein [Coniochaeta sp. 2T2.1]
MSVTSSSDNGSVGTLKLAITHEPESEPTIDIIAVHGLSGNPALSTWMTDLLPKDVRGARIMRYTYAVYTYNSESKRGDSVLSVEGIEEAARSLLVEILGTRDDEKDSGPPIVFIAHDIGGLIVKKALVMAERSPLFRRIADDCSLTAFICTPHRASESCSWDHLVMRIVLGSDMPPHISLQMATRQRGFATFLEDLASEFLFLQSRRSIISIFQSQRETAGLSSPIIVDRYSATTGLVHEISVGRDASLQDTCSFSGEWVEGSEDRSIYLTIKQALIAETNPDYRRWLSRLSGISPPSALLGSHQIRSASRWESTDYAVWLEKQSSCIIASSGDSGSGKSLTAIALYDTLKKASRPVAYFSFTGTDSRRASATSFLASTVFQLLSQYPLKLVPNHHLFSAVDSADSWTYSGLMALFRSFFDRERDIGPFHLIIDGLHRCDNSLQPLLQALLRIAKDEHSLTPLKIAVFSQSTNEFRDILDEHTDLSLPSVVLSGDETVPMSQEVEQHATRDILNRLTKDRWYLAPTEVADEAREALKRCRNTVEVSLTLQSVSRVDRKETPRTLESLLTVVKTLPPSVLDAVTSRFRTLDDWARTALGWIFSAKRPLTIEELATALMLTDDSGQLDLNRNSDTFVDITIDLNDVFHPFLRVEHGVVMFINDNVRNMFSSLIKEERAKQPSVDEMPKSTIPADQEIARFLLSYLAWPKFADPMVDALKADDFVHPTGPVFGLATYAVQYMPAHYMAAGHTTDVAELVLSPRIVMLWSIMSSTLNPTASPPEVCVAHPFLMAAQLGFSGIVRDLQTKAEASDRNVAIDLASWGGHKEVVEIVQQGAGDGHAFHTTRGLEYASVRGHEEIVQQLLSRMKASGTLLAFDLDRLICRAAELGYESQVHLFLRNGANVEAVTDGITPLQHAARNGHASLVYGLLANEGADPNSKTGTATSEPLLLAAEMGYELIVKHVIAKGADMTTVGRDGTERSALFLAAEQGHSGVVSCLLDCAQPSRRQEMIDRVDKERRTALGISCSGQHDKATRLLLEAGANVEKVNNDGHTALYYAVRPGSEALTMTIMEKSSSIDAFKDIGEVFLHATLLGQTEVVKHILDRAAGLSTRPQDFSREEDGRRALHLAAERGFEEIVRLLLEAGVEVDEPDEEGITPLVLAAVAGEPGIVEDLLSRNADPQRMLSENQTILLYVVRHAEDTPRHAYVVSLLLRKTNVDPNIADEDKNVPLHWAVELGKLELAKALLDSSRVDINAKGTWNWTVLHYLTRTPRQSTTALAKLLLETGADPLAADIDGWLPIHLAAQDRNLEVLDLLFERAPESLTIRDNDGKTALHFAASSPHALMWLLERGVDKDAKDNEGATALISAVRSGKDSSVRTLLANGADIKATTNIGRSALHHAAYFGRLDAGRQLLQKDRTLLSCHDHRNITALYLAIEENETDFAIMLLDEYYARITDSVPGATLEDLSSSETISGQTPLILAVRRETPNIIRRLRKLKAATETRDKSGNTALVVLIKRGADSETLMALLDESAQKKLDINAGGGTVPTALHEAARMGELPHVKSLIGYGALVNAQGGQFNTAFSAAAASGFADIVEYFLEERMQKIDVSLPGGNFANALAAAIYSYVSISESVPRLLEMKFDVNATDGQGRSAFHIAAARATWDAIAHLRQIEVAQIPEEDEQGRTLLHYAAMTGNADVIEQLLEEEFESGIDATDVDGWKPLHWACRQNNAGVVQMLLPEKLTDLSIIVQATQDGWSPENIAITHGADEVIELFQELKAELASDEEKPGTDEPSEPTTRVEETKPGPGRRWKVLTSHPGVICDGCFLQPLVGVRWRCQNCQDFDYCFKCFWTVRTTHDTSHEFKAYPEWGEDRRDPETESDPGKGGDSDEQDGSEDSEGSFRRYRG